MLEELEECVGAGEDPGTILEAKELTRTIAAFLDALPKRDANIFLRRYFFLEDASAISARYGLRRDAVNQSLSRYGFREMSKKVCDFTCTVRTTQRMSC